MKDKLQVFAGAMMTPIIALVVAGFFIGIGSAFSNVQNIQAIGLGGIIVEGGMIHNFFRLINDLGMMVMRFLPLIFCIGITFSLAKQEKGWAAFGAVIFLLAMNQIISTMFKINGVTPDTTTVEAFVNAGMSFEDAEARSLIYTNFLGLFTYDSAVFGSYIAAFLAGTIHNKFYNKELPPALSFFSGPRFAIIMMFIFAIPTGIAMYYVWPYIASAINTAASFITDCGLFGTFTIGFLDKALLPFGLHHLIPVQYTAVGGAMEVAGQMQYGVTNIMYAQLADPNSLGYITRNFESGRILVHFGAIIGITLAMYKTADEDKKKKAAAILLPAAITAVFIGVTEPIEYTFLFVAPALFFLVYAPITALGYVLTEFFEVSIIGGSIRNLFPNLLQPQKVHAMPLLILIPAFIIGFYLIFKYLIIKFDIKTPGRGGKDVKLITKKEYKELKNAENGTAAGEAAATSNGSLAESIIEALGGADNIENVTNCATRLRVELKDVTKSASDDEWVNNLEAIGIVRRKKSLQIIYGTQVINITQQVKSILNLD